MKRAAPKTAGLRVEFRNLSSWVYPYIYHEPSGQLVNSPSEPIQCSKNEYCRRVDEALGEFDWTLPVDQLDRMNEREQARRKIKSDKL